MIIITIETEKSEREREREKISLQSIIMLCGLEASCCSCGGILHFPIRAYTHAITAAIPPIPNHRGSGADRIR